MDTNLMIEQFLKNGTAFFHFRKEMESFDSRQLWCCINMQHLQKMNAWKRQIFTKWTKRKQKKYENKYYEKMWTDPLTTYKTNNQHKMRTKGSVKFCVCLRV